MFKGARAGAILFQTYGDACATSSLLGALNLPSNLSFWWPSPFRRLFDLNAPKFQAALFSRYELTLLIFAQIWSAKQF